MCDICTTEFTTKNKKPIQCPYCEKDTCLNCIKQCTLLWASAPKCPHCNKIYSSDFIDSTFPKGFRRGPLRQQAIKNLQEQEMSLLPESMIILEERIKDLEYRTQYQQLKYCVQDMLRNYIQKDFPLNKLQAIQLSLRKNGPNYLNQDAVKRGPIQKKIVKCPKDLCNGFIHIKLVESLCALCGTEVCKECNATINCESNEEHACNEDDLKSWKSILETTVPCPKCVTRIQKISGCNQMWCTIKECNTAFDWQTGKIINGPLHNPHYHEYLRQSGQNNPAATATTINLACQRPVDILTNARISNIYNFYREIFKNYSSIVGESVVGVALQFLRSVTEIFDYFREPDPYGPNSYLELRLEYLRGLISKEKWASKMSHKETLRVKMNRISTLRAMYQATAADIFLVFYTETTNNYKKYNVMEDTISLSLLKTFGDSNETLRLYYAKEMLKIISDYSDAGAKILYKDPENYKLYWKICTSEIIQLQII